jgi:hypothetical protein
MQLVAYGAQDVYLTGNPQITFFKVVYRRHTNFAMESMEQTLNGTADFNNKVVCRVSRNGDLMGPCYIETTLPASGTSADFWVNRVGFALIKQAELRIGGQMIDKQSGTWMHVWTELSHSTDQKALLDKLVGPKGTDGVAQSTNNCASTLTLQVPLQFAFCRNPGLALPLIALQYHEVELHIEFDTLANVVNGATGSGSLSNTSVWVDYMFLDTEERKNFAQNPHEYLIETVQTQTSSLTGSTANSVRLVFNHPTKELVWVAQASSDPTGDTPDTDEFTAFDTSAGGHRLSAMKLKLNGQDRMAQRNGDYYNYVQPYQHHTGKPDRGIYAYSFALKPEEHQPSGTCNFSRIDNANLECTTAASTTSLTVFAHSYNVLRVASGMGGLAYSN